MKLHSIFSVNSKWDKKYVKPLVGAQVATWIKLNNSLSKLHFSFFAKTATWGQGRGGGGLDSALNNNQKSGHVDIFLFSLNIKRQKKSSGNTFNYTLNK